MNIWKAITLNELQLEIEKGLKQMSQDQLSLWSQISIKPQKWSEHEYGSEGGGFWVVAINQNDVIWYNDIEEGFNISTFSTYG